MQTEMDSMERLKAFESVPVSSVPEGVKVLPSRWVFKIKPDKYKARICVRGDMQPLSQAGDTFSPTLKFITVRLLFAIAALYGLTVWQMDVCNAFVNATLDTSRFISNGTTLAPKKTRFSKPHQVLSSTWEGPGESLKGL